MSRIDPGTGNTRIECTRNTRRAARFTSCRRSHSNCYVQLARGYAKGAVIRARCRRARGSGQYRSVFYSRCPRNIASMYRHLTRAANAPLILYNLQTPIATHSQFVVRSSSSHRHRRTRICDASEPRPSVARSAKRMWNRGSRSSGVTPRRRRTSTGDSLHAGTSTLHFWVRLLD